VSYGRLMEFWEAAGWGLAGGAVAGLVQFAAAIISAGYRWPFRRDQIGPGLAVFVIALAVGAVVAGATHDSLRGPWPALVMGLGAPATIRGLLSGVQVQQEQPESAVARRKNSAEAKDGSIQEHQGPQEPLLRPKRRTEAAEGAPE
jgi:hypothetical protein